MTIALTGATGFLGSHLLASFEEKGIRGRALIRSSSPRKYRIKDFPVEICEVDWKREDSLAQALGDCDILVHLAGLTNGAEGLLRQVNVEYTRKIVQAADKVGMKRIIFTSSVAALLMHGIYGETKREAEELIRGSGIPYVIFRPAFIYGEGDERNTGLMIRTLKRFPLVPLLGGGTFLLQPVYVDDVVSLLLQALHTSHLNQAYTVAGPKQIALREILVLLAENLGFKRVYIPIPLKPAQALVRIYTSLFKETRLPVKQVLELDKHEAFDISQTRRDFDFNPIEFREGVQRMFQRSLCAA